MAKSKLVLITFWLLVILIGPVTLLRNTSLSEVSSNTSSFLSFMQRLIGLVAFAMLFFQIMIGSFMISLTEKFGGWIFKFHTTEGAVAYTLLLAHPILYGILGLNFSGPVGLIYVFFPQITKIELAIDMGKLALWLITLAVLAAKLMTKSYLRRYWRKLHTLNYLAFFLVAYHSFFIGTDSRTFPFVLLYPLFIVGVIGSIFYKYVYPFFKRAPFSL